MTTQITETALTNFQRLSYARIEPTGSLIILAGKNATGKTSVIDGIEATLTGHNSRNIKRPIKDGHGKASLDTKLSDGSTLTRSYTPSGTTLKGRTADGKPFGQRELDARISSLGIDGRRFISLGEKEQLKALLSIVDLPFDPTDLDQERKRLEEERRLTGQQERALGDIPEIDNDLPTEETSATDLLTQIREAQESNSRRHSLITRRTEYAAYVEDLRQRLAEAETELADAEKAAENAPELVDVEPLEAQLATLEEQNAAIRANNQARDLAEQKEALGTKYDLYTADIHALDQKKADGLAQAVMPIEGLSFDNEGVLYQGVPFTRGSGREQLLVSAAMIMATDPEIRVIVIRDGNVLDTEGLQLLHDMAEATNFQIFIEIVQEEKGDTEYYFVDGAIE